MLNRVRTRTGSYAPLDMPGGQPGMLAEGAFSKVTTMDTQNIEFFGVLTKMKDSGVFQERVGKRPVQVRS